MTSKYQKHRLKWNSCERCDLCATRNKVVLARGTIPAPILFVGEAPGASENVLGRPFVGPAGHLLDWIIEKALNDKYDYAITNLVACLPTDEDGNKIHEPPPEAIKACRPRLVEFFNLVNSSLIIAVGRLAEKELKTIPFKLVKNKNFISIIHPAAILRMDISQKGLAVQRNIVKISDAVNSL